MELKRYMLLKNREHTKILDYKKYEVKEWCQQEI